VDKRRLREQLGLRIDVPIVGTLGRLVRDKRIDDFIGAARLVARETEAVFLIGGTGPDEARLRSLAYGQERVVFMGEVHDPERFHGLCDVSVLTSIREGLSVSLQEAMATGCVPVATRGVGCGELVTDGVRDIQGLSGKIIQALENIPLGRRARETILRDFNIENNVLRYVELYEGLLRR
jgi:glycosyltransferase involved in cell wall biosynthesis